MRHAGCMIENRVWGVTCDGWVVNIIVNCPAS